LKPFLPPLVVLFVGTLSLAATASLWVHERQSEHARMKAIFDFNLRQTATRVEQRIANYEQMLRGAQGLFLMGGRVERTAFERYVDNVLAGPDAAGLQSFAYEKLLGPGQLAAHVAEQRAGGQPDYALRPPGERDLYAPVTFMAPLRPNSGRALGFDPLTEPERRAAMLQARDSGNLAITGRLKLQIDPATDTETAFLMFVPLYAPGGATDSVADRRAHATGWVSVSFRINDLMSTLYGEESPGLVVRLYDGADMNAAALMYRSGAEPLQAHPRFESQEYIAFAGRAWTLQLSSLPEFEIRHGQDTDEVILFSGIGLTLVLCLLTHQLVTARARATALAQAMTHELRDSEARYRRIVETASEGIWIVDAARRIAFVNPRIAQWLGTTEGAMQGRPLDDFMDPDEAERGRAALAAAPAEGGEAVELRLRRVDGSYTWVAVAFRPILDDAGRPAGALGMLTDVNERRHAEERRAVLEAQLRESQKMEAIGTLAGGIAHDFNNILAAIIGNLAAARQEAAEGASNDTSLAKVERSAVRARSLVQQILTFSRTQSQVLHTQALQPILEETLQMLRAVMPATAVLDVRIATRPVFVRADATQMQQVVMNLCANAWQALPGGRGRVEVGLEALDDLASSDTITTPGGPVPPGPLAHLWVADTGSGMDEATRSRVFEPFFTTKQVGHGTGLGLAVVHGIVNAHGGTIRVRSAPGMGTRFDLHFPLQPPPAQEAAAPPPEESAVAPRGHGQHVLCIDDDPAMVLMTEGLLLRSGYRVSAFEHPHAALAAVRADPAAYDLCVTDFNMPDMNGMDLAQALADIVPGLPVIITSGFISDEMRARVEARQIGALLQKEYTLERLAGLVHALLARRPDRA
jgi:PAS domain S-box-containing protein